MEGSSNSCAREPKQPARRQHPAPRSTRRSFYPSLDNSQPDHRALTSRMDPVEKEARSGLAGTGESKGTSPAPSSAREAGLTRRSCTPVVAPSKPDDVSSPGWMTRAYNWLLLAGAFYVCFLLALLVPTIQRKYVCALPSSPLACPWADIPILHLCQRHLHAQRSLPSLCQLLHPREIRTRALQNPQPRHRDAGRRSPRCLAHPVRRTTSPKLVFVILS